MTALRFFRFLTNGLALLVMALAADEALAKPRLVVWVTVDSLGSDLLQRNQKHFRGGLKTLLQNGAVFPYAEYPYAQTVTAVGHTTLVTGATPRRHGIVGNYQFNPNSGQGRSIFADEEGVLSPLNILSETVGDKVMISTERRSSVVSVALKPYAAVALAGKLGKAYWFDAGKGAFDTSAYYASTPPEWLTRFNAGRPLDAFRDQAWEPLQSEKTYEGPRRRAHSADWLGLGPEFPHRFPSYTEKGSAKAFYEAVSSSPLFFDLQVDFALSAIKAHRMGADEYPDVLLLSFASIDWMSHLYGPQSWEVQDSLRRLDVSLQRLFEAAQRASSNQCVVVLSADHGSAPPPEELSDLGWPARRIKAREWFVTLAREIEAEHQVQIEASHESVNVFFHWKTEGLSMVKKQKVRAAWAQKMRQHPSVALALSRDELFEEVDRTGLLQAVRLSFHPERSGEVLVVPRPYHLISHTQDGAFHGTPYRYDSEVPVFFYGKGIRQGWHHERVSVLSVAPTVTALMEVGTPSESEGNILDAVFAR